MNRDTAELPIVESAGARALSLTPPAAGAPAGVVPAPPRPGVRAALRARAARALRLGALDAGQLAAARDSWRALWSSRLLVFAAGVGTVVTLGMGPARNAFNPPGVTHGFGRVADVLVSPVARWDSDWYLVIAHWGYQTGLGAATASRTAYFPLYPLLIRALAFAFVPLIVAGVLVSLVAFALALYGIHRLTSLELGGASAGAVDAPARARAFASRRSARLAVLIVAFSPMALFFSAVYSESLYLALTVAFFWSARHGRWATAGVLGALAGATRSTGLVLVAPALILYLYGPRADRRADFAWRGVLARRLLPRYRPRASLLWLALLPAGFAAYGGWLALSGGHFFGPFHTEQAWGRHFAGPYVGAWDGIRAAFEGARQLLSFQRAHLYWPAAAYGSPFIAAAHNLANVAFLLAAAALVLGTFRRLPFAYGVYALAALALPLSYPVAAQPLMSLPRYMVVLFPLSMRLAAWLSDRPRSARAVLVAFALLIVLFVGQFATWHWVA
jgi:Mannosyltransferase (PIG-V)